MEAMRTWTFEGGTPLVVTVYKPAMTIQCGDGPVAELTQDQFTNLCARFVDIENYFDTQDPEIL
jgi:hypothetical protein